MEKIFEFFKEVGLRIKSPLVSSYIMAWLVVNWKIPVGFLFYTQEQLIAEGYASKMDLVKQQSTSWNFYIIPLIITAVYLLFVPVLRTLLAFFNAFINRWQTQGVLKRAEKGVIPASQLYKWQKELEDKEKQIGAILATASKAEEENKELLNKLNDVIKAKQDLEVRLSDIYVRSVTTILHGHWWIMYLDMQNQTQKKRANIYGDTIAVLGDEQQATPIFKILHLSYNPQTIELFLAVQHPNFPEQKHAVVLRPVNNHSFDVLKNSVSNAVISSLEKIP